MDFFLKISAVLLLIFLIAIQLLMITPFAARLYVDDYNGSPIRGYQTTVRGGFVTLDALGRYVADSARLMINGVHVKDIDRFPVRINLADGDVVEVYTRKGAAPFYVYISERSPALAANTGESSIQVKPGVNLILKAVINQ